MTIDDEVSTRVSLLREARSIFPDASVDEVIEAAWFLLDGTTRLDDPGYVFAGPPEPRVINESDEEPPVDETEWIDRGGRAWTHQPSGWKWNDSASGSWSTPRPWSSTSDRYGPTRFLPLTENIA